MNDILITLEGLLKTIVSTKDITINLYRETQTDPEAEPVKELLITFLLPGYDSLDDTLMSEEVKKIEIVNTTTINVVIQLSNRETVDNY